MNMQIKFETRVTAFYIYGHNRLHVKYNQLPSSKKQHLEKLNTLTIYIAILRATAFKMSNCIQELVSYMENLNLKSK